MGCIDSKPEERSRLSEMKTSDAKFSKVYTIGEELGSGAFSVVRVATNKETGKRYAVKIIKKSSLGKGDEGALRQVSTFLCRESFTFSLPVDIYVKLIVHL